MKRILYIIFSFALAIAASAQDPHHSQFFNLPAYYNPSYTGHDVEHIRATAVYRHQWPSLSSPFITQGFIFDKQVSRVGLGALLNTNSTGPAGIKRLQFGGMLSYKQNAGNHRFAVGIYTGLIQKSFDQSEMTFDDQYNDDAGFSAANPTEEVFSYAKVIRPDFGAGFLWTMGEEEDFKVQPYIAASFMHINQPGEVFIDEENLIPVKQTFNAGARVRAGDNLELKPSVLFSQQQYSREIVFGSLAAFHFEERTAAEAGIYIRQDESVIAYAGYRLQSFMAGFSYDITTSNSIGGPGAFELTLSYIPKAKPKKEKKKAPVKKTESVKKPQPAKTLTPAENKPEPKQIQVKQNNANTDVASEKQKTTSLPDNKGISKSTVPVAENKTVPAPLRQNIEKIKMKRPALNVKQPLKNSKPEVKAPLSRSVRSELPAVKVQPVMNHETVAKISGKPLYANSIAKKKPSKINADVKAPLKRTVKAELPTKIQPVMNHEPVAKITGKPLNANSLIKKRQNKISADVKAPAKRTVKNEIKTLITATEIAPVPKVEQKPLPSKSIAKVQKTKTDVIDPAQRTVKQEIGNKVPNTEIATEIHSTAPIINNDNDGDGIPNAEDQCPELSGNAAGKGCPDHDEDGIADSKDRCPGEKGSTSNDGCPANYIYAKDRDVKFAHGSSGINGFEVIDILEPISDSLFFDKNLSILITGHTGNEGDNVFNMKLSLERAEAVKKYFVSHGVRADRIVTAGYGNSRHAESEETEDGKKANRRAEIYLIRKL